VVFFVALKRLKKVIGIELDKNLIDIARQNNKNLKMNRTPIEFINEDVVNFNVDAGNIFFIYNPFGKLTLAKVVNNIKDSLITNPRKIRIVYYAPGCRDLLDGQDWLALEGKIENNSCLVWHNKL
ncbi:MAG: hypothetical protein ABIH19_04510, partial [Candidatus Omnitrophota bacterium]